MNHHHPYENEDEKPPRHHTHSTPHYEQFQSHFNQKPKKKKEVDGRPLPITILSFVHSHTHSSPHQTQQFPSDPPQNFYFHEPRHPHNQYESNLIESPQPQEQLDIDPDTYPPPSHTQDQTPPSTQLHQAPPSSYSQQQPQGPIVLKVSGIPKEKEQVKYQPPAKLPDGPPVFYAPSPDVQIRQRKKQQAKAQRHGSEGVATQHLHQPPKKKRRNSKNRDETFVTTHVGIHTER
jgi:hypothetical protein